VTPLSSRRTVEIAHFANQKGRVGPRQTFAPSAMLDSVMRKKKTSAVIVSTIGRDQDRLIRNSAESSSVEGVLAGRVRDVSNAGGRACSRSCAILSPTTSHPAELLCCPRAPPGLRSLPTPGNRENVLADQIAAAARRDAIRTVPAGGSVPEIAKWLCAFERQPVTAPISGSSSIIPLAKSPRFVPIRRVGSHGVEWSDTLMNRWSGPVSQSQSEAVSA